MELGICDPQACKCGVLRVAAVLPRRDRKGLEFNESAWYR